MEPEINAADLWSNDRSRIDTPLVSAGLEAETQWAIFGICDRTQSSSAPQWQSQR